MRVAGGFCEAEMRDEPVSRVLDLNSLTISDVDLPIILNAAGIVLHMESFV